MGTVFFVHCSAKVAVEDSGKVERNVSGDALLVGECTEIADASVLYSIKGMWQHC